VLLGPIDVGARSRIGGNVWLRGDVPEDSLVELPAPVVALNPAATDRPPAPHRG